MKRDEQAEAGRRALPLLPIRARTFGRGFARWTRGLRRPFDVGLTRVMVETTKFLVEDRPVVSRACWQELTRGA